MVPDQGDIITLEFDPQLGHEQKGRRPALVISNSVFNQKTGLAFVCPISSTNNGFPLHVPLETSNVSGFVLVEHTKSLDFNARSIRFIEKASNSVLQRVLQMHDACF